MAVMKRVIAFTMLFLAFFTRSTAQGYLEGANLSYDLIPLKISDPAGAQSFNANNFKLNDIIPVYLSKDKSQYLLFGLNLESLSFPGAHTDFPVTGIYSIAPVVGYSRPLN